MKTYRFDVVIIGAGPAGVTAAGALAGTGISVALIEAGAYAGAENWSGCVYFTESLAERDCFGPAAVQQAPYERQVVRRGTLMHNGVDEVGLSLTDPAAFRHCYTVLRPVYDPYFALLARDKGAALITDTTVTSLIRKSGQVIGVNTGRGPLYAGVVFLAEGDASHLVRAEDLERTKQPHFLQGVKAVLSLPSEEIEKRFNLRTGEGAAYEILIRNGLLGGRTAKLNIGGFLYTNRDSLSLGYVLPLDNLKKHYRGDHSLLLEWMRSLPYLKDLTAGAQLSSYGTKLVRSGGWRERPILVQDGLVVGGASAGLGIDIPFPNFTGPASATGLYFARAVKALLNDGKSFDKRNLTEAYIRPLETSVYSRNAKYLSRWPSYFGSSSVLFGRNVDVVCGTARFLSRDSFIDTARFLRSHLLSFRGARELLADTLAALTSLGLWKPMALTLINPTTGWSWIKNLFRRMPDQDPNLKFILNLDNQKAEAANLPWPFGNLARRLSPALGRMLGRVYANDNVPMEQKIAQALTIMLRSLKLTDLVILPLYGVALLAASLGAAIYDAFRYYVLKISAEKMLAEPVMAYNSEQRIARDLDRVKPSVSLEAKLALNTYRVGSQSHIRTRWPRELAKHPDMTKTGLWWLCPARVYSYDAPLSGRGKVTVNWENCIKCESCWRAEPEFALWGRFTDHRLIYRPKTASLALLLSTQQAAGSSGALRYPPTLIDKKLWYGTPALTESGKQILLAARAFREAVESLPASVDAGRNAWPIALGKRLCGRIESMENLLLADSRTDAAADLKSERNAIELRLDQNRLFHSLSSAARLEQRMRLWLPDLPELARPEQNDGQAALVADDVRKLFPDQVVKQWEEGPLSEEWADKLRAFIIEQQQIGLNAVRALSSINPALGLIAAGQFRAQRVLSRSGQASFAGFTAFDADAVEITNAGTNATISGVLNLVPTAATKGLLLIAKNKAYVVHLPSAGVTITPTPAIGFRAALLCDVRLDVTIPGDSIFTIADDEPLDPAAYLAIALGAADYLSRRAKEHASGRVQFPGQMLDTEGRDGIAKLGAVKAMIGRIEAWKLLLNTLYDLLSHSALRTPNSALGSLSAAAAALAFSPESGALGYDAGQVFGGFAYSEDDLLSRFYRDSSLFRFLPAGRYAARDLHVSLSGQGRQTLLSGNLGRPLEKIGKPLDKLVLQWKANESRIATLPEQSDPMLQGNAEALLLGTRAVLASVDKQLDSGKSSEAEAAAAEVLLGLCDEAIELAALSAGRGHVHPDAVFPMEPDRERVPLDMNYEAFCNRPAAPYQSGAFLLSVFDRGPRFVPEMQLHDEQLRKLWQELTSWFKQNCRDKRFDGLSFERHVDQQHILPPDIVDGIRRNKWLATYIPTAEDGLGWRKAGYYALNSAAGSFGDAAVCLLIMANTSIGTTPILLGLHEELPRVREELEPLVRDEKRLREIGDRLKRIIASFRNPNPGRIRAEYQAVMGLVDSRIRHTKVVKYLAARFLRAFYTAGIAGQRGDFNGFMTNLRTSSDLFGRLIPDVRSALEELPRRERCHKLFLRALGHGGVSAFALTEPTAGSDSGGVKTTATLKSAMLAPLPDGRYSFSPTGEPDKCLRYLIDADRIVFTAEGMAYQAPDDTPCLIRHDRLLSPDGQGARYYLYQDSVREFHDLGQVRSSERGPVYEYYSLTGSKMWITNGSIATQFSLYAQSAEGVTGFMVDRHAEGLKVGADERKTGQRGSPTNELALDGVRVSREAVIGYEGHGQVNALETLNVGRCGLAAVAGAISRKVMDEARNNIPASDERDVLLGEAAAIQFGSEAVAYHLIGLFDRPHESVRMESAIAKFLCSEDIHEVLTLVEQAFGPVGQTERFLLEKARRDARILNIYEGTNEVQRFLVLKDLIGLSANWPELPEGFPERPDDERAATLARWKNRLGKHVAGAAARLGDAAWSDAMLQPALFPLAGMAGELFRLECVWLRMEWLDAHRHALGAEFIVPMLDAGKRAAERALSRISRFDIQYESAWTRILAEGALPEVRAADAALDVSREIAVVLPKRQLAGCRVLSILRPVADLSPDPLLNKGTLRELLWKIDPQDLSALSQALELKSAGGNVSVDVLFLGASSQEDLARQAGAKADRIYRMALRDTGFGAVHDAVAQMEQQAPYAVILCGSRTLDGSEGLAPFLAGAGKRILTAPDHLELPNPGGRSPVVAGITTSVRRVDWKMSAFVDSLQRGLPVITPASPPALHEALFSRPQAAETAGAAVASASQAAAFLDAYAAARQAATAPDFEGPVAAGKLPSDPAVWAIIDQQGGRANRSALLASARSAGLFGKKACAFVAAPKGAWPRLLGLSRSCGVQAAFCIDTQEGALSELGKEMLLSLLRTSAGSCTAFAGSGWNHALAKYAGSSQTLQRPVRIALNASGLTIDPAGRLAITIPAYEGKLLRKEFIEDGEACISFSDDAEVESIVAESDTFTVCAVNARVKPEELIPLEPEQVVTLEKAEVIIDLGYGIRDRDGLALAGELKAALEARGLRPLFGATRKVTQDLKLLPLDAQIGQTGVRVNPKVIIALGISGAPQHIDYLGTGAEILCFNKDPEAPLMKLNSQRSLPKVHPIEGDLFVTVRELIARIQE